MQQHPRFKQRGGVLVMAVLGTAMVCVLATSMVVIQVGGAVEQRGNRQEARAALAAEAGLSRAYMALQAGKSGVIGSSEAPINLSGGEVFVTTATFGPTNKLVRVSSSAALGNSVANAELVLKDNVDTMFRFGAFGDTSLDLASQAKVDSYDSTLGTYASQAVHGSGSNSWADNLGDIGSNGDISASSNAKVFGAAAPGVSASITLTGTASVTGSTANATAPQAFTPIVLPTITSLGNKTFSSNTTLPSGSYHYGTTVTSNNKTLTITGPATVVFDSLTMNAQSSIRVNSTNGEVNIYVIDNFVMNSGTLIAANNYDPRAVHLNMLSDNIANPGTVVQLDNVAFQSNAKFYGTIYAPDAFIDISSNFEAFGSVIAEKVRLASNSRVHYDEALGRVLAPGAARYACISWRVMH